MQQLPRHFIKGQHIHAPQPGKTARIPSSKYVIPAACKQQIQFDLICVSSFTML